MQKECVNKWYHTVGRVKKAFVCVHQERPLYAKGYCKQCYLSIYKHKTNVKLQKEEGMGEVNSKNECLPENLWEPKEEEKKWTVFD